MSAAQHRLEVANRGGTAAVAVGSLPDQFGCRQAQGVVGEDNGWNSRGNHAAGEVDAITERTARVQITARDKIQAHDVALVAGAELMHLFLVGCQKDFKLRSEGKGQDGLKGAIFRGQSNANSHVTLSQYRSAQKVPVPERVPQSLSGAAGAWGLHNLYRPKRFMAYM